MTILLEQGRQRTPPTQNIHVNARRELVRILGFPATNLSEHRQRTHHPPTTHAALNNKRTYVRTYGENKYIHTYIHTIQTGVAFGVCSVFCGPSQSRSPLSESFRRTRPMANAKPGGATTLPLILDVPSDSEARRDPRRPSISCLYLGTRERCT